MNDTLTVLNKVNINPQLNVTTHCRCILKCAQYPQIPEWSAWLLPLTWVILSFVLIPISHNNLSTCQKVIRCEVQPCLCCFCGLVFLQTEPNHVDISTESRYTCSVVEGDEGRRGEWTAQTKHHRSKTRRTLFPSACQRLLEAFYSLPCLLLLLQPVINEGITGAQEPNR